MVPHEDLDCHGNAHPQLKMDFQFELKVIVPEGRIWAVDKLNPDVMLWQHKVGADADQRNDRYTLLHYL